MAEVQKLQAMPISKLGYLDLPQVEEISALLAELRHQLSHRTCSHAYAISPSKTAAVNRRTRCATDLALRLLRPVDRQRYREEWAAELADLPRKDQAPHALRLLSRALRLRRGLIDKPATHPRWHLLVVGVVIPGGDALVALCGLDWPAAVVGVAWMLGLLYVISSKERTQLLISLIREARTSKAPTRK